MHLHDIFYAPSEFWICAFAKQKLARFNAVNEAKAQRIELSYAVGSDFVSVNNFAIPTAARPYTTIATILLISRTD
jgi:hypothetical protein